MRERAIAGFIFLALLACAVLSSHQHKPFEMPITATPASICLPDPPPKPVTDYRKRSVWEFDQRRIA